MSPFRRHGRTTVTAMVLAVVGTALLGSAQVASATPSQLGIASAENKSDRHAGQGPVTPVPGRSNTGSMTPSVTSPSITRSQVISRAQSWVGIGLVYNQSGMHDGYRTDCSGYVSMAWDLSSSLTTDTFIPSGVAQQITKADLKPGDALLNDASGNAGHVVLFESWTDSSHTAYNGYEFSGSSNVVHRVIPYPYFAGYGDFFPVRLKNIVDDVTLNYSQTSAADFNGDGQADIIASDHSADLNMWTHNSGGYFTSPVAVTGGWDFTQTVSADFTGDGKADIVARDGSGNLKLWPGRGDGTFAAPQLVTSGWDFTQTAAADFDGNGTADLIARDSSGNLKIWSGRGDGTFVASSQLTTGWNFTQTVGGDFNGDGQADIMAADSSGNLQFWTHNADGHFNAPVNVTAGWDFSQTTAADFDGNGTTDLIARDDSTGDLYLWSGRGDGTFVSPVKLTSGW